jgi:DNA-binding response OmpR family regulator
LIVLDVGLPGIDGFEVSQQIRGFFQVPVISLTGYAETTIKLRGFEAGADDYIVKPFGRDELVARVGAALRRASMPTVGESAKIYSDDELTVDFDAHVVSIRGERAALSPLEFKLLGALVRNAEQVIGVQRLIDLVWGADSLETSPESVRVYVSYLRGKIERQPKRPQLVQTVRGFGYRYSRPASSADSAVA